jgi:tRNA A37 threonylcarbamoyladenosine dehydratase
MFIRLSEYEFIKSDSIVRVIFAEDQIQIWFGKYDFILNKPNISDFIDAGDNIPVPIQIYNEARKQLQKLVSSTNKGFVPEPERYSTEKIKNCANCGEVKCNITYSRIFDEVCNKWKPK